MKTKTFLFNIIFLLIFGVLSNPAHCSEKNTATVKIGNNILKLEVASTEAQREKGLMGRTKINPNTGMLFVFDYPQLTNFWMKNMKTSIDIVFISDKKIGKIYYNVPICTTESCPIYPSEKAVKYVIETQAGFCKRNGIKPGMNVQL